VVEVVEHQVPITQIIQAMVQALTVVQAVVYQI
jgi:hypothetical protein